VQMWVMPRAQDLKPNYGQVDFALADREGRWLTIASGEAGAAPITIFQDATLSVARLDGAPLTKSIAAERFAFLFVAAGEVTLGSEKLAAGDSARIAGPFDIEVGGKGEIVLWDLPPLPGKNLT